MSEDRRPNVAGVPLQDDTAPEPETGSEELRNEARLLGDRKSADGHEPSQSPPDDPGEH
ncbi:MAG TPA: hypothetical protein VGV85_15740 [Longimicrobiaceae bacterium]|nr:hypothetical protein [Longimicrobiaceae bacterium]